MARETYNKATSMLSGILTLSVHTVVLGLSLFGLANSHKAEAVVLSGRIEGSCQIEALNVCSLNFFSDISHDENTPIIASQVLANGVVIHAYRNDALNPLSDLGTPGRTLNGYSPLAARCGQTYTLELVAQASDEPAPKSIADTRAIPCPANVP
jgi:hypothetical protein